MHVQYIDTHIHVLYICVCIEDYELAFPQNLVHICKSLVSDEKVNIIEKGCTQEPYIALINQIRTVYCIYVFFKRYQVSQVGWNWP